ncbi:MAG: ABC transporter ATP-binding protein [Bacteroidetes bacterium]|nr:ABC transporter ATP-binding protein [Bacteroidota bacterium]
MTNFNPAQNRGEAVRLSEVTRSFGAVRAVDSVSLDIPAGSFFSLLGPSGCGKSTTLRIISGFEFPDDGKVFIGEKDVTRLDARRRPTVMVFQSYALFPHMSVKENVEYGLKVRKMKGPDREKRVQESLERVDMEGFLNTPVTSLSGGQQQRVALARAVAIEPDVILFDEPLSNLDVTLRQQTRVELKALQRRLGLTSIYVTHDQEEALALSDQIAVMRDGKIVQVGDPKSLYNHPKSAFVASFLGGSNILVDPKQAMLLTGTPISKEQAVAIRSEHISVVGEGGMVGQVVSRQFLGMITEMEIEIQGARLSLKTTQNVPDSTQVFVKIEASQVVSNDL